MIGMPAGVRQNHYINHKPITWTLARTYDTINTWNTVKIHEYRDGHMRVYIWDIWFIPRLWRRNCQYVGSPYIGNIINRLCNT